MRQKQANDWGIALQTKQRNEKVMPSQNAKVEMTTELSGAKLRRRLPSKSYL